MGAGGVVRLSALVCVHNQDAQLSECLRRLSFCDEIVVVADRCTDRSQDIARRHGAVVIDGIFPLENQRKAAGVDACSHEWILEVEPDEVIDAALAWEIRAVLQMRPAGDWYDVPIDNYVGETLVRDGWTGTLSARIGTRLYKRGLKAWDPRRLNAPAVMAGTSGGALKGAIRRSLGRDVGGLVDRLNRFTGLSAEDIADTGRVGGLGFGFFLGLGAFLDAYVGRGGWREGKLGFMAAIFTGLFPALSRMRAADVLRLRNAAAVEAAQPSRARAVVGLSGR